MLTPVALAQQGREPVRPAPAFPPGPAESAATLGAATVPAAGEASTLLRVTSPGRFMIRADSASGVALQLVDMMTGPGARVGAAGTEDGRLDVLLDAGVYKLRAFGAAGTGGEARLTLSPFCAVAAPSSELARGGERSAALGDLELRSYWIVVGAGERAEVEAAGRALKDVRLWRNGVDLVDLAPEAAEAEPRPGQKLTRLRLSGAVEPGLYLATLYGGPPAAWANGSAQSPLHIRIGPPRVLAGGWFEGMLGPSGVARFEIPPPATHVRLDLPSPAPAGLRVSRGGQALIASIGKTSREPAAALDSPAQDKTPAVAEVTGLEGQRFVLRALAPSSSLTIDAPGTYLISAEIAGEGGDEVPATALLARFFKGRASVVQSQALRLARGEAWRGRFNLRGPTSLIFEIAEAGPVALRTQGPGVTASLAPLLGANAPRADGAAPRLWDVEPGFYQLKLEPVAGAAGTIEATFGQPGFVPPLAASPRRLSLDFGQREVEKGASYQIFANGAPGLTIAPAARKLPANLGEGPLVVLQEARPQEARPQEARPAPAPQGAASAPKPTPPKRPPEAKPDLGSAQPTPRPATAATDGAPAGALVLSMRAPAGGAVAVVDQASAAVPIRIVKETADGGARALIVAVAPSERARRLVLSWSKRTEPAAVAAPVAAPAPPLLRLAEPRFLDLVREEPRAFALTVEEGGLYSIETIGRLKTALSLGARFNPAIATAADNGVGHNARLNVYLRAGAYRLDVRAMQSDGRAGVVAKRVALVESGRLAPSQNARATLDEESGAAFDVEAPRAGDYRIDLFSLGRAFSARLEDADGWPLTPPGPASLLRSHLEPGRFRLVVPPGETASRLVARLSLAPHDAALAGHGPHALPFGEAASLQWREPADPAEPREADLWTFSLAGPAHVALAISEGMSAALLRAGAPEPLARITPSRAFAGSLEAGDYRVEARAMGRNDRLDYRLRLDSDELQPGAPRKVEPPAAQTFALARERIVNLTGFGSRELVGTLKDAGGQTIERLSGRADDWTPSVSRRLPAGAYTIALAPAIREEAQAAPEAQDEESAEDGASEDAAPDEAAAAEPAAAEPAAEGDAPGAATAAPRGVELLLSLPEEIEGPALDDGPARLSGKEAHRLAAPQAPAGSLLVIAAEASADAVLSLERREPGSAEVWRTLASDRGRAPVVALTADGDLSRPLRASVWPVDGAAQIVVAARIVDPREKDGAAILGPLDVEGMTAPLAVAAVALASPSLLQLGAAPEGLLQGSAPGRPLAVAAAGVLSPQTRRLWFLRRGPAGTLDLRPTPQAQRAIELDLAMGDIARLAQPQSGEGSLRAWLARSAFGQPGLTLGKGMGVAVRGGHNEALALTGGAPLSVWNARADGPLRVSLEAFDLAAQPMIAETSRFAGALAPGVVQMAALPDGAKEIDVALGAGAAALLDGGAVPVTLWGAGAPAARRFAGSWTRILLFNVGAERTPASFQTRSATNATPLAAGRVMKRFFGAAGSFSLRVDASPGDRLIAAGARATFIGDAGGYGSGPVLLLPGPGELILDHEAGLVAAWIEREGASPWPAPEPKPAAPPQSVRLEGEAMTLALTSAAAGVLTARSDAPVILALSRQGEDGAPQLFPAGAEFSAYAPAGAARLSLYAAQEGPLSGSIDLAMSPLIAIREGLGEPQVLAPGAVIAFSFDVAHATRLGVGLRSDPDGATLRLLDENGRSLGAGIAQLRRLEPGRYVLEARAPADGPALTVRPALIGVTPPSNSAPLDVAKAYFELVGLKPAAAP